MKNNNPKLDYKLSELFNVGQRSDARERIEILKKLPDLCQEMIVWYLSTVSSVEGHAYHPYGSISPYQHFDSIVGFFVENLPFDMCESPIEQAFLLAWTIVDETIGETTDIWFTLQPQVVIEANGNKYRADFLIDCSEESWFQTVYESERELKLIIECDGYEYHNKTKEQVSHDNQRNYDLKISGYDVLHFSGTEIYQNPFKCAEKVYAYVLDQLGVIASRKEKAVNGDI